MAKVRWKSLHSEFALESVSERILKINLNLPKTYQKNQICCFLKHDVHKYEIQLSHATISFVINSKWRQLMPLL